MQANFHREKKKGIGLPSPMLDMQKKPVQQLTPLLTKQMNKILNRNFAFFRDVECLTSLDDYIDRIETTTAFVGVNGGLRISQWMMVAKLPQDPMLAELITNLGRYFELNRNSIGDFHSEVILTTGPTYVQLALWPFIREFCRLPLHQFDPCRVTRLASPEWVKKHQKDKVCGCEQDDQEVRSACGAKTIHHHGSRWYQ